MYLCDFHLYIHKKGKIAPEVIKCRSFEVLIGMLIAYSFLVIEEKITRLALYMIHETLNTKCITDVDTSVLLINDF